MYRSIIWYSVTSFFNLMRCLCQKNNKRKVQPLSELVNARHLALEPLCCLSSCRIRRAARALAFCEISSAIFCACLAIIPLWVYNDPPVVSTVLVNRVYQMASNKIALYIYVAYQVVWIIFNFLLLLALNRFDNRLLIIYFVIQSFTFIFTILALIASALELIYSVQTFHIALLILCALLTLLRIWSYFVIFECYKFFKLCQVLVSLGANKGKNSMAAGQARKSKAGAMNAKPPVVLELASNEGAKSIESHKTHQEHSDKKI